MDLGFVTRRSVGTWMGHMKELSVMLGHWGLCLDHNRTHMDLGYATRCSFGTWMVEEGVTMT